MYVLIPLALIIPIYRAEFFLGFVIGMAYSFGVVLPTLIGIVLALSGALLYLYVRRGILFIFQQIFPSKSANRENSDN